MLIRGLSCTHSKGEITLHVEKEIYSQMRVKICENMKLSTLLLHKRGNKYLFISITINEDKKILLAGRTIKRKG